MGEVVDLKAFREKAKTDSTKRGKALQEIKRLIMSSVKSDASVPRLGTVELREQAVIASVNLMMEAHDLAAKNGYRIIRDEDEDLITYKITDLQKLN